MTDLPLFAKNLRRVSSILVLATISLVLPSAARCDSIGFLYALEEDFKVLRGQAPTTTIAVNGTKIHVFRLGPHRVFATRMGAGNVETALNTANLLAKYPCDWVVSAGPAGTLSTEYVIGDLVRIVKVVGFQRGTWTKGGWILAEAATVSLSESVLDLPLLASAVPDKIASGDAFIANSSISARIRAESGCNLVDMNSFGLAEGCAKAGVPLAIFKIVSDRADESADLDFKNFIATYGGSLGEALREVIINMPVSKSSPDAFENIRKLLP